MNKLSVVFPRKSTGRTISRALASLAGAADEALPLLMWPEGDDGEDTKQLGDAQTRLQSAVEGLGIRMPLRMIRFSTMPDDPATYGNMLPQLNAKGAAICSGRTIMSNVGDAANELASAAANDLVLVMNPGEECLDPTNMQRTVDHLRGSPQIHAVICPVKVYEHGEHVTTVLRPKIFRKSKASITGVLADWFKPETGENYIMAASGLTFMEHGDAWSRPHAADLFDCKLLLGDLHRRGLLTSGSKSDDPQDEARLRAQQVRIGELLPRWSIGGAIAILDGVICRSAKAAGMVPALVARARAFWRYRELQADVPHELDLAMYDLDHAIAIWPTAAAHLERGFVKDALGRQGIVADLERAVALAKQNPAVRGYDARELAFAELILAAGRPIDRCKEIYPEPGGRRVQCLKSDKHNMHVGLSNGQQRVWYDP